MAIRSIRPKKENENFILLEKDELLELSFRSAVQSLNRYSMEKIITEKNSNNLK